MSNITYTKTAGAASDTNLRIKLQIQGHFDFSKLRHGPFIEKLILGIGSVSAPAVY